MIALAFVVINVGKTAKDKTYADNAVDGGALAAASVMAYAFNYAANVNAGKQEERFKKNWEDIEKKLTSHFDHARDKIYGTDYTNNSTLAKSKLCPDLCGTTCDTQIASATAPVVNPQITLGQAPIEIPRKTGLTLAQDIANEAGADAARYQLQINDIIRNGFDAVESGSDHDQGGEDEGIAPGGSALQKAQEAAAREIIHDDGKSGTDLYQNALYAGYIYAFSNSGISHRLGRINAKRYSAFLESITPDNVNNCEEKTFSWMDGAFRYHTVTNIVCINEARTWKMKVSKDKESDIKKNLTDAFNSAKNAQNMAEDAAQIYHGAWNTCGCVAKAPLCLTPPCCVEPDCPGPPITCISFQEAGRDRLIEADKEMVKAAESAKKARDGLLNSTEETFENKDDGDPYVIWNIVDIEHDRQVHVYDFQFHMGGPVKGMRGDFDFPTFYPPVQSQACADFSGNGDIDNGQAAHDARLCN